MHRGLKRTLRAELLTTPVTILRASQVTDRYGRSTLDWTTPDRVDTTGFLHQQSGIERTADRDTQSAQAVLFLPPDTDINGRDRVEVNGHTWGVTGPPDRITPPGSAAEHHVEVGLRYVEG
jgi:hypothetical protein